MDDEPMGDDHEQARNGNPVDPPRPDPASLRAAVHGFSFLTVGEAVRVGISAVVTVLVARRLGAAAFGYYGLALSVVGPLTALVDGGLTSIGSREIARDPSSLRSTIRSVLILRLLLAAAAALILFLFVARIDKPILEKQVVLLAGLSLFTFAVTLDWVFYGLARSQLVAAASVTRVVVFAALTLSFVHGGTEVWLVPLFQAAGEFVAAVQLTWAYRRSAEYVVANRRRQRLAARLAGAAWPVGAGQVLRAINFWFSILLIGLLLDERSAGQFAAAQRLMMFAGGFVALYFVGYLPLISRGSVKRAGALPRLSSDSVRLTMLVSVPVAAGGMVLAVQTTAFVFGAGYAGSAAPLAILMWIVPALALGGHFRSALIADELVRVDLAWVGCSAVLNVALNLLFIRTLGLMGAAIAWTAAEAVLALGTGVSVRSHGLRIAVLPALVRPAVASAIMAACVLGSRRAGLAPAIVVGLVSYGGALLLMREPLLLAAIRKVRSRGGTTRPFRSTRQQA